MPPALNPERARIFRIVHRDNIPWILDHGLHAPNGGEFDPAHKNIGNLELIGRRSRRLVEVGPGGTLSDYVPFYFTPFSIMMYNIHTGHGVAPVPNDEIVILVSSLHNIANLKIPFVFTNQHAYPEIADYYTDLKDLDKIDWELLNRRDFRHDPDDPGKKERYQAEALIWKEVPIQALLGICSHSEQVNTWLQAELAQRGIALQTIIQRGWYFS